MAASSSGYSTIGSSEFGSPQTVSGPSATATTFTGTAGIRKPFVAKTAYQNLPRRRSDRHH